MLRSTGKAAVVRGRPLKGDGAGLGVHEWQAEWGALLETWHRAAMSPQRCLCLGAGSASPRIFPNGLRGMLGSAWAN